MAEYANLLLNKIIEDKTAKYASKLIPADIFVDAKDREVYEFIIGYEESEQDNALSVEAVMIEFDHFVLTRCVSFSYYYLVRKLVNERAQHEFVKLYDGIAPNYKDGRHDMYEFIQSLKASLGDIETKFARSLDYEIALVQLLDTVTEKEADSVSLLADSKSNGDVA